MSARVGGPGWCKCRFDAVLGKAGVSQRSGETISSCHFVARCPLFRRDLSGAGCRYRCRTPIAAGFRNLALTQRCAMKIIEKIITAMTLILTLAATLLGFGLAFGLLLYPFTPLAADMDPAFGWAFCVPVGFIVRFAMLSMLDCGWDNTRGLFRELWQSGHTSDRKSDRKEKPWTLKKSRKGGIGNGFWR